MIEPTKRPTTSVYDYSDKSVPQAGYAAIAYAVIALVTGLFALLLYFLYHRPGTGGFISHDFVAQQYLQHTPFVTAVALVFSIIIANISRVLAFGIFRRRRVAIVAMIVFVVALQLYTWFVARSIAGTLVTIVVVPFLLRGAEGCFRIMRSVSSIPPKRSKRGLKEV
jgi:hypothetical protein